MKERRPANVRVGWITRRMVTCGGCGSGYPVKAAVVGKVKCPVCGHVERVSRGGA